MVSASRGCALKILGVEHAAKGAIGVTIVGLDWTVLN